MITQNLEPRVNVIDVVLWRPRKHTSVRSIPGEGRIFSRSRNPVVNMNSEHVKELLHHDYHKRSSMV